MPIPDADLAACAALVERGDPDRFLALMAAPPAARGPLAVLSAFNLELARAPWVTREPLVARMRLQFWRDVVAEPDRPRAHEVAGPLAALIRDRGLPERLFEAMIAAREAEIEGAHLADAAALCAYVGDTAGALMALAVRALGGAADEVAQGYGAGQGMANYLLAVPALQAAGRPGLPDDAPEMVEELAGWGLLELQRARRARRAVPRPARPALLAAWRARGVLARAVADPAAVPEGRLAGSEFARRGGLLWASLVGV
jgi:phytoene/squalene synthetase